MRNAYKMLFEKADGRNHLEELGVDGRIKLKWVLRNTVCVCGVDSSGSG
jgi:hypothetical protein